MSNLITLTCPSCGGRLEVTNNTERYVCAHCGNTHIVDPGERAESLANEVEQMRLKMDIRQVEEDLTTLRERLTAIEAQLNEQHDGQKMVSMLIWAMPIGVFVIGLAEGATLESVLFFTLFLIGFSLLVTWIIWSGDSHKEEKRELGQLKKRIISGQQTLNFLQQELKRVSNSLQPRTSN
ncbi:MAG TPA: zinc ribbon domain-containing protein [Anaerolineae bacterium]|nr:zinc ribbon domain-containing protein [Anaerolineae bacterium]